MRVCDPSRCSLTKAQSRSWPSASWLMWCPPLFSAPCVSCSRGRLAPSTCTATPGLPSQEVSLLPHLAVFPDQGEATAQRRWTQTCICGSRRVQVSASWKTTTSRWSWEGDGATERCENVKILPHITTPQLKFLGPDFKIKKNIRTPVISSALPHLSSRNTAWFTGYSQGHLPILAGARVLCIQNVIQPISNLKLEYYPWSINFYFSYL